MGWELGSGLGRSGQGAVEPLTVLVRAKRSGLGHARSAAGGGAWVAGGVVQGEEVGRQECGGPVEDRNEPPAELYGSEEAPPEGTESLAVLTAGGAQLFYWHDNG